MAARSVVGLSLGLLAATLSCENGSGSEPAGGAGSGAGQTASGAAGANSAGSGSAGSGGASSGSGAGISGASGSSGSAPVQGLVLSDRIEQNPQTEDGACTLYSYAYCARLSYCRGADDRNCFRAADCPDLVFSPGSARTIESVVACAKAWATFSCSDLAAGRDPECAEPGTVAVGEPCSFASQCSTLACVGPTEFDCGECTAQLALNQPCSDGAECPGAQTCRDGTCQPSLFNPQPHLGEACTVQCAPEVYCGSSGKCEAYPTVGQACGDGAHCDRRNGAYCRASDVTCQQPPLAGQPCAEDVSGGERCDLTAQCEAGQCVALGVESQPCENGYDCAPSFACLYDVDGVGTCRKLMQPGEACASAEECLGGHSCIEGTCRLPVGPEKPCGDAATTCLDDRACEGQRCAARPLAGTFEDRCP